MLSENCQDGNAICVDFDSFLFGYRRTTPAMQLIKTAQCVSRNEEKLLIREELCDIYNCWP